MKPNFFQTMVLEVLPHLTLETADKIIDQIDSDYLLDWSEANTTEIRNAIRLAIPALLLKQPHLIPEIFPTVIWEEAK